MHSLLLVHDLPKGPIPGEECASKGGTQAAQRVSEVDRSILIEGI